MCFARAIESILLVGAVCLVGSVAMTVAGLIIVRLVTGSWQMDDGR